MTSSSSFIGSVVDSIRAALAVDRRVSSAPPPPETNGNAFKTETGSSNAGNAADDRPLLAATPPPPRQSTCRTCTDFQTYVMNRRSMSDYNGGSSSSTIQRSQARSDNDDDDEEYRRKNCPLDKDELGRSTWNLLHTVAATYPDTPTAEQRSDVNQFLYLLSRVYPCEICAEDFVEIIKHHPPRTDSQWSLSQWTCEVHNMVNRKLGKPQFDCSKVIERWRDGWKDGRCD